MSTPIMHLVSAKDEYDKNPDLKKEDVTALQEWMETQKHLPTVTEEMLILFHHSCYYHMEKTKDCIETYYTLRTNTPELFTNRDLNQPGLTKALSSLHMFTVPLRDSNSYQIVYQGLKDYDTSKYIAVESYKMMIMTLDACLRRSGTSKGVIFVFNMQGMRLGHLTRISVSPIRKFIQYIQEGNPIRLKAVHVINVVSFIDKIMTLIKPLMKSELTGLIHFYTVDNMETFYNSIPEECLPKDFKGQLGTVDELSAQHFTWLQELSGYFSDEEKFRADEKKRQKIKKKKPKDVDIKTDKLDIDCQEIKK